MIIFTDGISMSGARGKCSSERKIYQILEFFMADFYDTMALCKYKKQQDIFDRSFSKI